MKDILDTIKTFKSVDDHAESLGWLIIGKLERSESYVRPGYEKGKVETGITHIAPGGPNKRKRNGRRYESKYRGGQYRVIRFTYVDTFNGSTASIEWYTIKDMVLFLNSL